MIRIIRKLFSKLPLQLAITIPLTIQVTVAVAAVAYLSYRNGQAAVYDLANQLQGEITARIHQQLENTLAQSNIINQLNANALLRGNLDLTTGQGEHQLWQQIQLFASTNLIYCATEPDGAFLGVGRSQGGTGHALQIHVANGSTNRYFHYYEVDGLGHRGSLREIGDKPYDPRLRPWYRAALQAGQPTWSEVYLDFETFLPTITANTPVYDPNDHSLVGVCATDIILSEELNQFLQSLYFSPQGMAFIVEPSGMLIASSTPEPTVVGNQEDTVLMLATASENALIRATMQYLQTEYTDLSRVQALQQKFKLDQERYFLQTSRFVDDYGLDWLLVLVAPEQDFMADIDDNNQTTLMLYLLALLLTGLSGLVITQWVTQPLRELSDRARDLAQGHWDQPIRIDRSDAIGELSRSFATMAQQLREVFTTLEHRVEERNTELIQMNQELQRLAHVDGLTQTANRRYFDDYLEQEWFRLAREGKPLSLILCDADYFKAYNDTYGHQAGDQCLQQIAAVFAQVAQRSADLVARYGGEEFALILPNTSTPGAIHIAEQIRQALQALNIPHRATQRGQITVSLGIATTIPQAKDSAHTLVAAADRALYAAKAKGRNGYSIASGWYHWESSVPPLVAGELE
jgi:diguanylate cyclase (GGDEF)-like protein